MYIGHKLDLFIQIKPTRRIHVLWILHGNKSALQNFFKVVKRWHILYVFWNKILYLWFPAYNSFSTKFNSFLKLQDFQKAFHFTTLRSKGLMLEYRDRRLRSVIRRVNPLTNLHISLVICSRFFLLYSFHLTFLMSHRKLLLSCTKRSARSWIWSKELFTVLEQNIRIREIGNLRCYNTVHK